MMNTSGIRSVYLVLFFLFIFAAGIWLSHSGKPLNPILLAVHKLVSLAMIIFLAIVITRINRTAGLSAMKLGAVVLTGLFFLGTIISGGLLSTGKPTAKAILLIHQITPFLTVLSTFLTFYFLRSHR